MNLKFDLSKAALSALLAFCVVLTAITLFHYPGKGYIYLLFSVSLIALLFLGLRKDSIFFDFFIGALFWLGYWLKFSVRMSFSDGKFAESIGHFDYSGGDYDHSLLIVTCGVTALLLVRFLRARFVFTYPQDAEFKGFEGLYAFYEKYRTKIWIAFFLTVLFVAISNAYLGIYQRGMTSRTVLPYNLRGVYTWFLFFGATSVSALMLNAELKLFKTISFTLILLVLVETFSSSVSMLSRGMVLNSGALFVGAYVALKMQGVSWRSCHLFPTAVAFVILVASSVVLVNSLRQEMFTGYGFTGEGAEGLSVAIQNRSLLLDRWVGMEGAMAVSSYPGLGWELFEEALKEEYRDYGRSLYDGKISQEISEEYNAWLKEHSRHFISIPGVLSFFYYPGSFVFLFAAMMILGIVGAGFEIATYKWAGSNVILCSLIAFVVVFRYVHFGYAPARSYLLFGAVALNIILVHFLNRILAHRYVKE